MTRRVPAITHQPMGRGLAGAISNNGISSLGCRTGGAAMQVGHHASIRRYRDRPFRPRTGFLPMQLAAHGGALLGLTGGLALRWVTATTTQNSGAG